MTDNTKLNQSESFSKWFFRCRSVIAGDLFQEGDITRAECFRIEMDELLAENTGDLKFEKNQDYELGLM